MMTILVLLAAAAVQQPSRTRPATVTRSPANLAPSPNDNSRPQAPKLRNAYDTTLGAVEDIGRAVANVRAEMDRFRMTAANDAGGEVMESSAAFRSKCQDLTAASLKARRVMCRSCAARRLQSALNDYRAFLPA